MELLDENSKIELKVHDLLQEYVIDPEIGLNIIDLGLVYDIHCHGEEIMIRMTLTSHGCPMGDAILANLEGVVRSEFPKLELDVQLVWQPAWSPDFISEKGKEALSKL